MKLVVGIFIIANALYTFSFAKYSMGKKDYMAAAGAAIVGAVAFLLPGYMLLIR